MLFRSMQLPVQFFGRASLVLLVILVLVASTLSATPYARKDWHERWSDKDNDCRNLRHELLFYRSLVEPTLSADGCWVVRGLWRDSYTGKLHHKPREMQVDHRVALKEAHISGGWKWERKLQRAFAEDTSNLVITYGRINQEKGAKDFAQWIPTINACQYLRAFVATKEKWRLTLDANEQAALVALQEAESCKISFT